MCMENQRPCKALPALSLNIKTQEENIHQITIYKHLLNIQASVDKSVLVQPPESSLRAGDHSKVRVQSPWSKLTSRENWTISNIWLNCAMMRGRGWEINTELFTADYIIQNASPPETLANDNEPNSLRFNSAAIKV